MRDESFHTDREVGEFIEGLRASSRGRKRGGRSRYGADSHRPDQNAELLSMIRDMEGQLQALAGTSGREDISAAPSQRRMRQDTGRSRYDNGIGRGNLGGERDYRGALDRIEAQLQRVDQALGRNGRQERAAARPVYADPIAPAYDVPPRSFRSPTRFGWH